MAFQTPATMVEESATPTLVAMHMNQLAVSGRLRKVSYICTRIVQSVPSTGPRDGSMAVEITYQVVKERQTIQYLPPYVD